MSAAERVSATVYYIDAVAGADTGNGTTQATAWKSIAKLNATALQPGDMACFKRGQSWREQLVVPSSGAADYPITFGAYGTGDLPIINGADIVRDWTSYKSTVYASTMPSTVLFVAMDGRRLVRGISRDSLNDHEWFFENRVLYLRDDSGFPDATGTVVEAGQRSLGVHLNGRSNIVLQDLRIQHANSYAILAEDPAQGLRIARCQFGVGGNAASSYRKIYCLGNTNELDRRMRGIVITDCSLLDERGRIQVNYAAQVTIRNCAFAKGEIVTNYCDAVLTSGNSASYVSAQGSDTVLIEKNAISGSDMGGCINIEDGGVSRDVRNVIIQDNAISKCSYAGIWVAIDQEGQKISGLTVRRNTIRTSAKTKEESAGLKIDFSAENVSIYSNVITDCGIDNIVSAGLALYPKKDIYAIRDVRVWNNTFYNNRGAQLRMRSSINTNLSGVVIKNNLFYSTEAECIDVDTGAASDTTNIFNYNNYFRLTGAMIRWGILDYAMGDFAQFQAVSRQESEGMAFDPLLTAPAELDFRLQSGSCCIDTGADVGLTTDIEGNPLVGIPDRGAFEYQYDSVPPSAPTGLREL